MPFNVESASLEPKFKRYIAGGEDMWVHVFDFHTGDEISKFRILISIALFLSFFNLHVG